MLGVNQNGWSLDREIEFLRGLGRHSEAARKGLGVEEVAEPEPGRRRALLEGYLKGLGLRTDLDDEVKKVIERKVRQLILRGPESLEEAE